MRLATLLFCVLFLVWGARKIGKRPEKPPAEAAASVTGCRTAAQKKVMPHMVAKRDMGVNWRIRKGDLSEPAASDQPSVSEFLGKYVVCKVPASDPVAADELEAHPKSVAAASGKTLYLLTLKPGEEDSWNAGSHVDLYPGPTALVSNAEVLAVICDPSCKAALQLTPAEVELLKREDPLKLSKLFH